MHTIVVTKINATCNEVIIFTYYRFISWDLSDSLEDLLSVSRAGIRYLLWLLFLEVARCQIGFSV